MSANIPSPEKAEALAKVFSEYTFKSTTPFEQHRELQMLLEQAKLNATTGWVIFAGRDANGTRRVQFNDAHNHGFCSEWPEWAFEQAQEAMLRNKRLWAVFDGAPFGRNLLQVLITHQNA